MEVWVKASIRTCRRRDAKGIHEQGEAGKMSTASFEADHISSRSLHLISFSLDAKRANTAHAPRIRVGSARQLSAASIVAKRAEVTRDMGPHRNGFHRAHRLPARSYAGQHHG